MEQGCSIEAEEHMTCRTPELRIFPQSSVSLAHPSLNAWRSMRHVFAEDNENEATIIGPNNLN